MKTILVVDDNENHRKFIGDTLETRGYTVVAKANGEEALKVLRDPASDIDLVTVDWSMPAMNGDEVVDIIREDEEIENNRIKKGKPPYLPIVMITVFITAQPVKKARAKIDGFLPKPLSYQDILITVENCLKKGEK